MGVGIDVLIRISFSFFVITIGLVGRRHGFLGHTFSSLSFHVAVDDVLLLAIQIAVARRL
jgi:uncharacterized membrane protein YcgQ (UPF0703/DUF1980 family)